MEVWTWYCNLTVGIHSIKEIFQDFLGFYGQFLGCSIFWGWDDGISEGVSSLEPQDWESRWLSRPANQKWTHLYSGNCYRLSSYEVWTSQHFLADAVEHIASAIDFKNHISTSDCASIWERNCVTSRISSIFLSLWEQRSRNGQEVGSGISGNFDVIEDFSFTNSTDPNLTRPFLIISFLNA